MTNIYRYDQLISLGYNCHTACILRDMNLRKCAFPFDWSSGIREGICGIAGFQMKINMILNSFNGCFELENLLEEEDDPALQTRRIVNNKTGLQYIHDFPKNQTKEGHYPAFFEKYIRRAERLLSVCKQQRVLFLFICHQRNLPLTLVQKASSQLRAFFSNPHIDFLIFTHNDNCYPDDFIYHNYQNGIYYFEINNSYFHKEDIADGGNKPLIRNLIDSFYHNSRITFPLAIKLGFYALLKKHDPQYYRLKQKYYQFPLWRNQ